MLDPTVEEIQHAKKQRERIYNDDVYFTLKSVPEGIPEWAYNSGKFIYETDNGEFGGGNEAEYDEYDNYNDNQDFYLSQDYDLSQDYEDDIQDQEGQEDDQFFVSDFYQNSAKMNLPRPENLDEMGKSSSAAVS